MLVHIINIIYNIKMNKIPIVIALDCGSIPYISVLLDSIRKWIPNNKIYIITDRDIIIEGCEVLYKKNEYKCNISRITGHTFYRLFLDEIIPETKCIYLDFDTIVMDNISELLDGDDWMLKAVGNSGGYFNAGVLAFNFTDECKILMQKCRDMISSGLNDQDILNNVFRDKYRQIDEVYNVNGNRYYQPDINPKIIHYIGNMKPWKTPKTHMVWLNLKYNK